MNEHGEQVSLVAALRRHRPTLLFFAIPNGGKRTPLEGARLKDEGVLAGVPDLFFPSLRLFIEMKRKDGGVVSKAQKDVMHRLEQAGYRCVVCSGAMEAFTLLSEIIDNNQPKR